MKMKCDCEHAAQDEIHGKNIRVFNKTKKTPGNIYRCTVCLKEKPAQGETKQ